MIKKHSKKIRFTINKLYLHHIYQIKTLVIIKNTNRDELLLTIYKYFKYIIKEIYIYISLTLSFRK